MSLWDRASSSWHSILWTDTIFKSKHAWLNITALAPLPDWDFWVCLVLSVLDAQVEWEKLHFCDFMICLLLCLPGKPLRPTEVEQPQGKYLKGRQSFSHSDFILAVQSKLATENCLHKICESVKVLLYQCYWTDADICSSGSPPSVLVRENSGCE